MGPIHSPEGLDIAPPARLRRDGARGCDFIRRERGEPAQKHLPFHSFEQTVFVQYAATSDKPVQMLLNTGAWRAVLNWKAAAGRGWSRK